MDFLRWLHWSHLHPAVKWLVGGCVVTSYGNVVLGLVVGIAAWWGWIVPVVNVVFFTVFLVYLLRPRRHHPRRTSGNATAGPATSSTTT